MVFKYKLVSFHFLYSLNNQSFENKSFFVITIQVLPTYHVENFNKKMKMKTIMFLNGM